MMTHEVYEASVATGIDENHPKFFLLHHHGPRAVESLSQPFEVLKFVQI
jgi:hypothetical protein